MMHRCNEEIAEPLVSIGEAARNLRLNKSTLSRQISAGKIRSWGGRVRLSEVVADRAANVKPRRGGVQRRTEMNGSCISMHATIEEKL
jgi:hypothetical protein